MGALNRRLNRKLMTQGVNSTYRPSEYDARPEGVKTHPIPHVLKITQLFNFVVKITLSQKHYPRSRRKNSTIDTSCNCEFEHSQTLPCK